MEGIKNRSERVPILNSFKKSLETHTARVADAIHSRARERRILILGLSYKGDLKISDLSPTIPITRRLLELGDSVLVHDPLFSDEEVRKLTGAKAGRFPEDLDSAGAVVVMVGHHCYRVATYKLVKRHVHRGTWVLDVEGTWDRLRPVLIRGGAIYTRIGDPGWFADSTIALDY
jgi:UDP-N-acetyl-D-mannosaminuronate dehydrogenase